MLSLLVMMALLTPASQNEKSMLSEKEKPLYKGELLFAPQKLHNHGSCIVECANGDLLVCWYRGSGERSADDVAIMGARRRRGKTGWTPAFVMADTPGFPDCNPCMIIDPRTQLWLFWPTILANTWESALMKIRISRDYERDPGPPRWEWEEVLHVKPGPEFLATVERDLDRQWEPTMQSANAVQRARLRAALAEWHRKAQDKLSVRLGWMPRAHPFLFRLPGGVTRMIVPLYSDAFDFSLMAITDDGGATWRTSAPIVGPGCVQPSIARRRDGTLVAFFRDNGPPPARVMVSESKDSGMTWTPVRDTDLPDPGAGLEVIALQSGRWLLVNNDTEEGRCSLAVSISNDEGRTWPSVRHLEQDKPGAEAGSYAYPSILQAKDGTIHVTYSYTPNKANAAILGAGESIKHVQFNEAWLGVAEPHR
jgi:predicted neuraminidase